MNLRVYFMLLPSCKRLEAPPGRSLSFSTWRRQPDLLVDDQIGHHISDDCWHDLQETLLASPHGSDLPTSEESSNIFKLTQNVSEDVLEVSVPLLVGE